MGRAVKKAVALSEHTAHEGPPDGQRDGTACRTRKEMVNELFFVWLAAEDLGRWKGDEGAREKIFRVVRQPREIVDG